MKLIDLYNFINDYCPFDRGFSWDNSGIMCGDKNDEITRVLVTLDADMSACEKAIEMGANAVVSHHPLIFDPLRSVTAENPLYHFIKNGIAVISAHTCLDSAQGGVSQLLAEASGLENIEIVTEDGVDIARAGFSPEPDPDRFIENIKNALPSSRCDAVICRDVHRVLCIGGAGSGELYLASLSGCDTVVTGEAKHNHLIDAKNMGLNLFAFGHFETENPVVHALSVYLAGCGFDVCEFNNSPYERR